MSKPKPLRYTTNSSITINEIMQFLARASKETGEDLATLFADGTVYTKNGKAIRFRLSILEVCDSAKAVLDRVMEDAKESKE